ncbi:ComEA family DNA-binding protein [Streptomyces sp. NBC_01198]|uniref:ComEA family DNA-binding protein n=1 Tax=Streptomyces sp. NBC_01198 TaxID=2903769 RepID=UPI002E1046F4|nr:ComEA family DNA-binding protein [Streptomyces sp. NBC_01198]
MNPTNPLGPAGPITVVRPRRRAAAAQARSALARERASAIFGTPDDPSPPPPSPPPVAPQVPPPPPPPSPPPSPPEPSSGRLGGLRTWLLLRCGLEFRTVLALAVVLLVGAGLAVQHYVSGRPHAVRVPAALPPAAVPAPVAATKAPSLTIDIAGKVARPGLRRLPAGSRVADALVAAGGPLPGTDTTALNLARPLADGEQLLVGLTPPAASTTSTTDAPPGTPLSLNSATAPQLDALPGVGPVLAQHILDFRTQHGGFTTLQQLRQVPGIGDHKFTTLKPLVHP